MRNLKPIKKIYLALSILLATFIALVTVLPTNAQNNLIHNEPFESASGVQSNGGTIVGNVNFQPGLTGNAASFGTDGRVTFPTAENFDTEESVVEFDFKPTKVTGGLFDIGDLGTSPSLGIFTNGSSASNAAVWAEYRWGPATGYRQVSVATNLSPGTWHHVKMTFRCKNGALGNYIGLKVDNNEAVPTQLTTTCTPFSPTDLINIGYSAFYGYSEASIDELKIYEVIPDPATVKPQSTGPVKLNGKQLLVNNNPFFAKSVGYQPTPIGLHPNSSDMYCQGEIYNRDIPVLRELGANTIRTWRKVDCLNGSANYQFLDALYNNGNAPVYAIMGFWVDYNQNFADPTTRTNIKNQFKSYVARYKNHPAVLIWAIGNENNYNMSPSLYDDFYSLANEMAQDAYTEEGTAYHPVMIVNGEISTIGFPNYNTTDGLLPYVDMWGLNIYRGQSFGNLFTSYETVTQKPMLITEYGAERYNLNTCIEDQQAQTNWDTNLYQEGLANSQVNTGMSLMEYSDEWWKGNQRLDSCAFPPHDNFHQDGGGSFLNSPDNFSNEEWYGIVSISKNILGGADLVTKKDSFYKLQAIFKNNNDIDGDGVLTAQDNCPDVANPNQAIFDPEIIALPKPTPTYDDETNPVGQKIGTACNQDIDNDGLVNSAESFYGTNSTNRDSDGDRVIDSAEIKCSSNPLSSTSTPKNPSGDGTTFTQDFDSDKIPDTCEHAFGTDLATTDWDGDKVLDGWEAFYWNTSPTSRDSDNDLCTDAREIASVDGNRAVNVIDLQQIAARANQPALYHRVYDFDGNGSINVIDLQLTAAQLGVCQ